MSEQSFANLEPSWFMALKVWWSIVWRLFSYTVGAILIFSFIATFILSFILHLDLNLIGRMGGFFGFVLTIPISVAAVKAVLKKEYKDFKLTLVKRENAEEQNLNSKRE